MELHLLNRSSKTDSSFSVTHNSYPHFLKVWHYHPEYELVFLEKSTGTRFIGDSIQKFKPGEVILLGKNLPHMWLNDDIYFMKEKDKSAEAIAVHFKEDFLGGDFYQSPEFAHIGKLLKRASRGIRFPISKRQNIHEEFMSLFVKDPFLKVMSLLRLLNKLAKQRNYELLSSAGYLNAMENQGNERLDKVYAYVFDNFKKEVSANEVSDLIGMNPSAFSRFFKRTNRKPFSQYLNEIRVGYACKLLLENENTITQVVYESGFNNVSNFNRQFRKIKQMSPSEYIKFHKEGI
ncbi:AraC family transcriptional regulator [Flagellimonas flava]|uniref:AraC-type DNA-binding protein n=1 Tax=Flagellimonas flava TaxID=570519 RepID=A0A1M5MBD8_9FLAO|nr:AraC family transcriptional regulator [Allomuricauda flava]SHG74674.1 AraC-type DNA-binding protein [Allomuricauda flava]